MTERDQRIEVCVIFGGVSGEHEISLLSARSILAALDPRKYHVLQIGITHEGEWLTGEDVLSALSNGTLDGCSVATLLVDPSRTGIYRLYPLNGSERLELIRKVDVVFPVLHGTFGEDGTIQGLFELANIAYVGSGVVASAVGMDKGIFKDVMRANGIAVADSRVFTRREINENSARVVEMSEKIASYPLFVKPANLGSSVGVSKCHDREELISGLKEAARFDRRILVEKGIDAREIEVSVLGNEQPIASVPGEIIPADEFYSYDAKYHDNRSQLLIPAPLTETQAEQACELAIKTYKAIDAAGMARVDMLMERSSGIIYVNEINTIPGFTQISMYPKLWAATGIAYSELVDRLIELALERKSERKATTYRYRRENGTK